MKQTNLLTIMSPRKLPKEALIVKEIIPKKDGTTKEKSYALGRYLGKGQSACVYEATDLTKNVRLAIKIIPKTIGKDLQFKKKLCQEISLQKSLCHPNIVNLKHAFEDQDNIYLLLELCNSETLKEILTRKGRLNETEAKYYLLQLANAIKYLHKQHIIHRDIKLKNIFFSHNMELKLGDFGLSVQLSSNSERRYSVCGTIDYVAPEILSKSGYSYQADIWSFGVVAYSLLVGFTPFGGNDQRIIVKKIKENRFSFPDQIYLSPQAKEFISQILVADPYKRLSIDEIIEHPFLINISNKPFIFKNYEVSGGDKDRLYSPRIATLSPRSITFTKRADQFSKQADKENRSPFTPKIKHKNDEKTPLLKEKKGILTSVDFSSIHTEPPQKTDTDFVVRWIDYSSKYGLGYMLSKGGFGVLFNDNTQIYKEPQRQILEFIQFKTLSQKVKKSFFSFDNYPQFLDKKVRLFKYFQDYLKNNQAGVCEVVPHNIFLKEDTERESLFEEEIGGKEGFVSKWMKTDRAVFFKMNNKVVQVIFKDSDFLLIDPCEREVHYVDLRGKMTSFSTEDLGMIRDEEIVKRVRYVQNQLGEIWKKREED